MRSSFPRRVPFALLALTAACRSTPELVTAPDAGPPADGCTAPPFDALGTFPWCTDGSGAFGKWIVDDLGLPAYAYTLDEANDPRALYATTERDGAGATLLRRDHWAAFGNRRVNALAHAGGFVEVVTQDRGVEYLDARDDAAGGLGGAWSYLDDGDERWCATWENKPAAATGSRRFGLGYFETTLDYRDVSVVRRSAAPPGDVPAIVTDVTITNTGSAARTLRHYELWDVGRRSIEIDWLVSGDAIASAPGHARAQRDGRNAWFDETASWDPAAGMLGVRRSYVGPDARPARDAPSAADYWANDPFLAVLGPAASDIWLDQASFVGGGGVAMPDAVARRGAGKGLAPTSETGSGAGQPRVFAVAHDLALEPGESRTLRFAYGYAPEGEPWPVDAAWRAPAYDVRAAATDEHRGHLPLLASDRDPFLHRELAWHAYQLEASVGRRDYFEGHVVPQGSAYLYLHGADGAARDLGIFAVPLVYVDPALAREELSLFSRIQHADDGRFSYALQGHGMLDDALIHTAPSDLVLFYAWALGEYLGATGDLAFLDAKMPFHPKEAKPDATVWDHLVAGLRHQLDVVGTGQHGLVRVGTGDWSDGIVASNAPDRALALQEGESVPNTQMAIAVLPRLADLIAPRDAALAAELRTHVDGYRAALASAWAGEWYARAWFGSGPFYGADHVELESQVWALIADTFGDDARRTATLAAVETRLDDPSPNGAALTEGGQIWPAIGGLLSWAYARRDPERAWAHLVRSSSATHADAYPDVWSGIWSGPDGWESKTGLAWHSAATPMIDFPVQNANVDAMALLAALRVVGIDADAAGVVLSPAAGRSLALHTALLDLRQTASSLSGSYAPPGNVARTLSVVAPAGSTLTEASLDGVAVPVAAGAARVEMSLRDAGSHVFHASWTP